MEIDKRIDELIELINKASYEYYVLDNPTITDQEYDDAYKELLKLEEKYPEKKRIDSPTNRVGGEALSKFDKAYVMDIKCDREDPIDYPGITSDTLISKINNAEKISIDSINKLLDYKDSVICFMSCANITPMIEEFKNSIK